ncbi:hypothetical protein AMR42_13845 [Limnothrix sp. PR1529]|nr:hypothetical protein BCR12_15495 [Limnothrix sp. P13C2]PIB08180.1 hypothetical protein AMR42_13845 [Limnothrix sp. PR1529]
MSGNYSIKPTQPIQPIELMALLGLAQLKRLGNLITIIGLNDTDENPWHGRSSGIKHQSYRVAIASWG